MILKSTAIITAITAIGFSGCTVYLPPSEEAIPSADPIIVPGKATTPATSTEKTTLPEVNITEKSNNTPASPSPSKQGQTFYIVKPKDTVFAVMRNTGVHWKEIIKLNHLKAPKYTIFPGQSLRVK